MAVRCIHANINFTRPSNGVADQNSVINEFKDNFTTDLGLENLSGTALQLCDGISGLTFRTKLKASDCLSSRNRFAFFATYKNGAVATTPENFKVDRCGPVVVKSKISALFNVDCSTRRPAARAGVLAYDPRYGTAYGMVVGRGRLEVVWGKFRHLAVAFREEQKNSGCYRPCNSCHNPNYDCSCKAHDWGYDYYSSCKKYSCKKPCVNTYTNFKKSCDLEAFGNFYLYANYKKSYDCGECKDSFVQWLIKQKTNSTNPLNLNNQNLVNLYKQWTQGSSVSDLTTYEKWIAMINNTKWKTRTADSKGSVVVRRKTIKTWRECSPYTDRDLLIAVSRRTKCVKFFYKCHKVYQLRLKKMGTCIRVGFGIFCFGPDRCRDCCGQTVCINVKDLSVYVPCDKTLTDKSHDSHSHHSHHSHHDDEETHKDSTSSSSLYLDKGTESSTCHSSSSSSSCTSTEYCSSESSGGRYHKSHKRDKSCGPCKNKY